MTFGLYIHWPFCATKCPYCDFNSHIAEHVDETRWLAAYQHEIHRTAAEQPHAILGSIFFGGGTPSLMAPATVAGIIDCATTAWRTTNQLEISLEANPGSVDAGNFAGYRTAGVNRVSLGIQSLDDQHLRALGRQHDRAQAIAAIGIAQQHFGRVNIDLIYARQHQKREAWRAELAEALSFGTGHLAPYQLSIEAGTVFHRRFMANKLRGLPDEDLAADLYEITQELCDHAGLPAYEISNHARPGEECRHNLGYWSEGAYAGIGPGAHGRLTADNHRVATAAIRLPGTWLEAIDRTGSGELPREVLTSDERIAELLMMGLRRHAGVDLTQLDRLGRSTTVWPELDGLLDSGHLEISAGYLRVTSRGRLILDTVLGQLLR